MFTVLRILWFVLKLTFKVARWPLRLLWRIIRRR